MPVPPYEVIDDNEFGTGKPIPASMLLRFRNNLCALFGLDPINASPSVSFGVRAEIFVTPTTKNTAGATGTVTGASSPYTWTVPAGVTLIMVAISGGGGQNGVDGGDSTVVGSTSGTLVTANGSNGDVGGAADGFCGAGGDSNSANDTGGGGPGWTRRKGANGCFHGPGGVGQFGAGGNLVVISVGQEAITAAAGYGGGAPNFADTANAGAGAFDGGGGAAAGEGLVTVVPGETLTLTVGAKGGSHAGDGFIRLRW